MNAQQTIVNARKKIAQLEDATDAGDLLHRHGVASGWLAALRLERLIDGATFEQLAIELGDAYQALAGLEQGEQTGAASEMTKTCHAAELVATVAGLSLGRALKGATTQVFITGNEIYLAQQTRDFAQSATLDDLAAMSVHFGASLQLLRRERELAWESLEIAAEDRPAVLEEQRRQSAVRLVAWLDCMRTFGLLTSENATEMTYQVLDLRDDTPGATAKDASK